MKYIMIFIRNTFLIEILYNKGCVRNCRFLPIIMREITLLCICNPNTKVKFLSIPYDLKKNITLSFGSLFLVVWITIIMI